MKKQKETSFPKDKINILLLENISDSAVEAIREAGYANVKKLPKALEENELIAALKGVHILGIRSKTQITKKVIEKADKLLAVGCYCIGTNQVDLKTAATHGVAVFNAPFANTRSVAELVIGLSILLLRKIVEKNDYTHHKNWQKGAEGCYELREKTMGIIGYGNIGSQVSVMAESLGMKVIYYDIETKLPHGNARPMKNSREVLKNAHIVTLHVPSDPSTRHLINEKTLAQMREGAYLINYSRGDVVDLDALKKALDKKQLAGAAIDVFPIEPEKNGALFECVLQGMKNVILTPHIGGSTEEAQEDIGFDVSAKLINFLEKGTTSGCHTIPQLALTPQAKTHRILHIHENIPGVLGEINSQLSSRNINIAAQYLKTNDQLGYVVLDIDSMVSKEAFAILKKVKGTIKTRMLY